MSFDDPQTNFWSFGVLRDHNQLPTNESLSVFVNAYKENKMFLKARKYYQCNAKRIRNDDIGHFLQSAAMFVQYFQWFRNRTHIIYWKKNDKFTII